MFLLLSIFCFNFWGVLDSVNGFDTRVSWRVKVSRVAASDDNIRNTETRKKIDHLLPIGSIYGIYDHTWIFHICKISVFW